jgi:hypothetical protein
MIDHTGIGGADVARSAVFYDAALGALGPRRVMQLPENKQFCIPARTSQGGRQRVGLYTSGPRPV